MDTSAGDSVDDVFNRPAREPAHLAATDRVWTRLPNVPDPTQAVTARFRADDTAQIYALFNTDGVTHIDGLPYGRLYELAQKLDPQVGDVVTGTCTRDATGTFQLDPNSVRIA